MSWMRVKWAAVLFGLVFSCGAAKAAMVTNSGAMSTVTWSIKMTPAGGGVVLWASDSPDSSGALTASGKLTFEKGAYIKLTFQANKGYTLQKVLKGGTDITTQLDFGNTGFFGPVGDNDSFVAVFSGGAGSGGGTPTAPTGTFPITFPSGTTVLVPVFDISGTYSGISPTKAKRAYNLDVAVDEFGKVSAMGTIQGLATTKEASVTRALESRSSTTLSAQVGSLSTVAGKPMANFAGKFSGARDGAATSCNWSVTGPAQPVSLGTVTGLEGTVAYKAKINNVAYQNTNLPVQLPLPPAQLTNLHKAWGIQLNLQSQTVKNKSVVTASAVLTLPFGEHISFSPKPAKYSTKGYSLSFKHGMNVSVTPVATDKASSITITGMTLVKSGTKWTITGGTMAYKFLGQSGTGDLASFVLQ